MSNASRARLTPHQRTGRSGRANDDVRKRMFARRGDRCAICGHRGASDSDHIVPLSKGGHPTALSNRQPAHGRVPCYQCPPYANGKPRRCNQDKGNMATSGRGKRKPDASHKRLNTSEAW